MSGMREHREGEKAQGQPTEAAPAQETHLLAFWPADAETMGRERSRKSSVDLDI